METGNSRNIKHSLRCGCFIVGIGDIVKGDLARRIIFHRGGEALGVLLLVLGIVAIIGGIFSIRRNVWGLALAGAICVLFPPHVAVMGILAIIFVALSKGEFDQSVTKATDGNGFKHGNQGRKYRTRN